jgi:hypothetical protein
MASTYSDLKIELIGTGEQAGTWGNTTNTNLGTAVEEAITGSADVSFPSSDVTLTLTNLATTQAGRNLRLNLTGTSGGARNLILGSDMQINKLYLVNNTLLDAVTVKNTTGTGIAVPAGKTMFVFNNGTNVVDAVTHLSSLTLGAALPIASGGTGSTSTTFVNLATNVTGTLPVANGGTGITSFGTGVATFLGTPSSANLAAALTDETGTGLAVFGTTPTLTGLREAYSAVTSSSGTATLDFSAATVFQLTLSEDVSTFTWNNAPTSGTAFGFTLKVIQDSTARTIAFPASVDWPGGIAPTLSSGSGDVDVFTFFTIDGGTTYYGFTAGQDLS